MKVLFMTGSHPRHAYMARCLEKAGVLSALVIEKREAHVPSPPEGLSAELSELFVHHFQKRQEAESKFFSDAKLPEVETFDVTKESLNSPETQAFIRKINPDILMSYGVHILTDETLNAAKKQKWNIHGGLSPWYRGTITHFWPSYMLQPQMTGMTMHNLTQEVDGGAIVHQSVAELVSGDGLHDLACRAVMSLGEELPKVFEAVKSLDDVKKFPQRTTGRLWLNRDWRPEHLKLIYQTYNDKVVDHYLKGDLHNRKPKLNRQF